MGRERRPYLPGGIFHLTARTIRWERWFTAPARAAALRTLAEVMPRSQVRLMAAAIMPNHLHIVVQQGDRPLSALMQPLLRRLAFILQKQHHQEGPIFWRPYTCTHCSGPRHTRNAIVYTHLNPMRAKLCSQPADFAWTTHALYAGSPTPEPLRRLAPLLDPDPILPIFATSPLLADDQLRRDYLRFVRARLESDGDHDPAETPLDEPSDSPEHLAAVWGELGWRALTGQPAAARSGSEADDDTRPGTAPSLADLARITLGSHAPGTTLDDIRGRGGGRRMSRLRHQVIRRLNAAGYPNIRIARFLDLSESAVSYALNVARP